jgi:hypothetical protein
MNIYKVKIGMSYDIWFVTGKNMLDAVKKSENALKKQRLDFEIIEVQLVGLLANL